MRLRGNTRLSLYRKGIEVKRVEKHNTITDYVSKTINQGNFCGTIPNSKIMPIKQWFDGCILTDQTNDASLMMISKTSTIKALAGNSTDLGSTDDRRGAFNALESGDITGGFRFVWDWGTDRGNGTIASVCLTRSALALAELQKNGVPTNPLSLNEPLTSVVTGVAYADFASLTIIDYEKEVGYKVDYSNGDIVIDEYPLSTRRFHLEDTPLALRYDYQGAVVKTTHTITQAFAVTPTHANSSINYTGSHIHWVVWDGDDIYDYVIDTSTWELDMDYGSSGVISRTFNSVAFTNLFSNGYDGGFRKDVYPIIGDYIWMWGSVSGTPKILKCNLLGNSPTEIHEYDNPYYTKNILSASDVYKASGCSALLQNGDVVKMNGASDVSAYINDYYSRSLFYRNINDLNHTVDIFLARTYDPSDMALGHNCFGMNGLNLNDYGTAIYLGKNDYSSVGAIQISTFTPHVSTVNNLQESVEKSADLTMKLTYEITEEEEES